jgi:hypothetical protein
MIISADEYEGPICRAKGQETVGYCRILTYRGAIPLVDGRPGQMSFQTKAPLPLCPTRRAVLHEMLPRDLPCDRKSVQSGCRYLTVRSVFHESFPRLAGARCRLFSVNDRFQRKGWKESDTPRPESLTGYLR